jgi:hypothetical protein
LPSGSSLGKVSRARNLRAEDAGREQRSACLRLHTIRSIHIVRWADHHGGVQAADTELFNQRPSDCQYERERNLRDHQPIALAESGDAVDDAKDGGVGADPERQGQDSNCGETRMLSERATGVDKIGSF